VHYIHFKSTGRTSNTDCAITRHNVSRISSLLPPCLCLCTLVITSFTPAYPSLFIITSRYSATTSPKTSVRKQPRGPTETPPSTTRWVRPLLSSVGLRFLPWPLWVYSVELFSLCREPTLCLVVQISHAHLLRSLCLGSPAMMISMWCDRYL
jgi:hypothetical protein